MAHSNELSRSETPDTESSSLDDGFVYARRLDYDPDPSAPLFEADDVDPETLPALDSSQLETMLNNPWASRDELEQLGLPIGAGAAAFRVGDEVRFINIDPSGDYGTWLQSRRVRMTPAERYEVDSTIERELSADEAEKIGEEVLEVVGVEAPKERLDLPTLEAAKERIASIVTPGAESTLAKDLLALGSDPEEIIRALHDNSEGRARVRAALTTRLHMLLNEMPDQIKDDREKNVAHPEYHGGKTKMPSREYAVDIALAYLDGSFNAKNQERSGHGKGGIGEHRTAAQKILESFAAEAPQLTAEKELFTEDRLQAFAIELRGKAENISNDLGQLFSQYGDVTALRSDLQGNFTDNEVLAQYASRLQVAIDTAMQGILQEISVIGHLKEHASFRDNPRDVERADSIRETLQTTVNILDEARNSWTAAHVFGLTYNADQQLILQLKSANLNGMFDEQLVYPIEKARQMMDELSREL